MFKNTASQKLTVIAFADAGHATLDAGEPVTGDAANITMKVEQDDDGTQSASNDVNPTEVEDGQYRFDLTQAETNGDKLTFYPESSTAGVQVVAMPSNVIYTRPPNFPNLGIETDGDLTQVNTCVTNSDMRGTDSAFLAASAPTNFSDLSITATTGRVDVESIEGSDATDQINAACDTAVADQLAVFWTSPATLVDLVWDEVITGAAHNVNNSAAKFLREASEAAGVTGTAQAGAATTITLAAGESATDDLYNFERVRIIEGTGAGQSRLITDYDGTSKVATVDRAWTTNPSSDSVYVISSADATVEAIGTQLVTATATVDFDDLAAILTDTNELQTDWADGGRLDLLLDSANADTQALLTDLTDGTVVVGTINDGAIGAAAVADIFSTTAITEAYAADGAAGTPAQILYLIQQSITEFAIASTTKTIKKLDGSTTAATETLDDATNPTSITRAT